MGHRPTLGNGTTTSQERSLNHSRLLQHTFSLGNFGRHERTRTADPFRVREVLYQLSYVPKG